MCNVWWNLEINWNGPIETNVRANAFGLYFYGTAVNCFNVVYFVYAGEMSGH